MNVFTATGRITGDATYRRGSDAHATNTPDMNALGESKPKLSYGRFNVAVDCPGRKEKTTFVTVVCFGKMADFIGNGLQQGRYLKGCAVEFDGPLQPLACYKDQQGVDHYYMEVWANFTYSHVHKNWNSETKSLNVQTQGNSYVQNQNNYGNNNVYGQESFGNGTSAGNPNNQRQNGAYGTGNPARTPSGNPNGQRQNSSYGTGVPAGNPNGQMQNGSYRNGSPAGNLNSQRQNGAYRNGNPAGNPNGQRQNGAYGNGNPAGNPNGQRQNGAYGNGNLAGNPNSQRQNGAYGPGNRAQTPSGNPNGQGQNSSYVTGVPTGNPNGQIQNNASGNGASPSSQFETENSYPYENGFSPSGYDSLPDEMPPAPGYVDNVPSQSADGFQPATYNY